jgi:hypothetical protein
VEGGKGGKEKEEKNLIANEKQTPEDVENKISTSTIMRMRSPYDIPDPSGSLGLQIQKQTLPRARGCTINQIHRRQNNDDDDDEDVLDFASCVCLTCAMFGYRVNVRGNLIVARVYIQFHGTFD